jgi:hypothetical protein
MINAEVYGHNLEALQANADIVGQLVETMDGALQTDAHMFGGRLSSSEWFPMSGASNPALQEFSLRTARGLLGEVNDIQSKHALVRGKLPPGIQWHSHVDIAFRAVRPGEGDASFLRRFNVWGMETATGDHEAAHYRFDWKEHEGEGSKNSLIVARLGRTVIKVELWTMPDEDAFAIQCFTAFANTQIVNDVLRGEFADETDLDRKLDTLSGVSGHPELYGELRTKALAARRGREFVTEHNLWMPNRDGLTRTLRQLNQTFDM